MKIGSLAIAGKAFLAPMAGASDRAFREICSGFGAAFTTSEMVSAKALQAGDRKTARLMDLGAAARPAAVQLFGSEPKAMAAGARRAMEAAPDAIDLNMGCPAPKITRSGAGSALMKDPGLCAELVAAVREAADVPVTVKIRAGWDETSRNAAEVARACERAGASAVAVHARTRAQMFAPPADWNVIREVRQAVGIPVIGNGDVFSAADAARMLEETGCDAVLVGRGALGNPWIFQQIDAYLSDSRVLPPPDIWEKTRVMLRHIGLACRYKGEARAMKEARGHVGRYLKGLKSAAQFRRRAAALSTYAELEALSKEIAAANAPDGDG